MGTCYRIVCGAHKEVLDLSKMWELNHELREFVSNHHLEALEDDGKYRLNEPMKEICIHNINRIQIPEKPRDWIRKHRDCMLFFQSDAESWEDEIYEEDGWRWIDI